MTDEISFDGLVDSEEDKEEFGKVENWTGKKPKYRDTSRVYGGKQHMNQITEGKIKGMRNLPQYRDLTDDEFAKEVAPIVNNSRAIREFEGRILAKIDEFAKDYDLSDLNSNDKLILRALAQALINLEDYERSMYTLRASGVSYDNLTLIEKLSKVMSDLRGDISDLQNDLMITRKVRKSDKDESTIAFIENLKRKSKEFYKSKMGIIICPKCKTWIGSAYFLYPDAKNKIKFVCNRVMEDGNHCGGLVEMTSKELMVDKKGCNMPEVLPEVIV